MYYSGEVVVFLFFFPSYVSNTSPDGLWLWSGLLVWGIGVFFSRNETYAALDVPPFPFLPLQFTFILEMVSIFAGSGRKRRAR